MRFSRPRPAVFLLACAILIHTSILGCESSDADGLRRLSRAGTLWIIDHLRTGENLLGNENNYLNFLTGMAECASDKQLRRLTREEAIRVSRAMLTPPDKFLQRFHDDVYSLAEYLQLFQRIGVVDSKTAASIVDTIVKEQARFRGFFSDLKKRPLYNDELFDAMLVAYDLSVLKKQFPGKKSLARLPDLDDFLEILATYRYAFENREEIDLKRLDDEAIRAIYADLYNITHVFFVFADYSHRSGGEAYFQRELAYVDKLKPYIASKRNWDVDLTSQVVDFLLGSGYSKDDPFVQNQWARILSHPRRGGQWMPPAEGLDPEDGRHYAAYHEMHTTWTITKMITAQDCTGPLPFYPPLVGPLTRYAAQYDKEAGRMRTVLRRADDIDTERRGRTRVSGFRKNLNDD